MEIKAKKVAASLKNKGLVELRDHGDKQYRLWLDGKKTGVSTMISHGDLDLGTVYLSSMARQLELSLPELLDLIRCPLTAEGFIELLKGRGRLD